MTTVTQAVPACRALLEGAIDYAGLYPPASLGMADAAHNYLGYALGSDAWALGRFVVPVSQLGNLRQVAMELAGSDRLEWRLSVVTGPSLADDVGQLETFLRGAPPGWTIDAIEARASSPDAIVELDAIREYARLMYVELPLTSEFDATARAVASHGAYVKIRTGGVVESAFPSPSQLADAIVTCSAIPVGFKATAGLHHPIRGPYPMTYALDADVGVMFGYVNLLLAAAAARSGEAPDVVARILDERSAAAFSFGDDHVGWRGSRFTVADVRALRLALLHGFGSCSFREPLDEFAVLGGR
ncbi:MAG: hypothetical protein MNPFHGCM_01686 [Gemmatimonadaceae bacterium]|nr:hypothetical protein [Gemmatimonadaceae bacterium]